MIHCIDLHRLFCFGTVAVHPECVRFQLIIFFIFHDLSDLDCHLCFFFRGLVIAEQGTEMFTLIMRCGFTDQKLGPMALFLIWLRVKVIDFWLERELFRRMDELFNGIFLVKTSDALFLFLTL